MKFGLIRWKIRKPKHHWCNFSSFCIFWATSIALGPWVRTTSASPHKSSWTVSLFIGKRWRFGGRKWEPRLSLPPGSASGSPGRERRNAARQFYFSFFLCPRERRERACRDVWKHSFPPAALRIQEGKAYLSEQRPYTPHPPIPLFIGHIIGECKQRLRVFSCAAARLWSAGLSIPSPLLKLGKQWAVIKIGSALASDEEMMGWKQDFLSGHYKEIVGWGVKNVYFASSLILSGHPFPESVNTSPGRCLSRCHS